MAHLFESGFSVREVPWHGLGNVLDQSPENWTAAREAAGLQWEPVAEPLYKLDGIDPDGRPIYTPVTTGQLISRSDTRTELATVSGTYTLITHDEMGQIIDAMTSATAQANARAGASKVVYETAGVLDGGKAVWALLRLSDPVRLKGDPSETLPYMGIFTRHDGAAALTVQATAVRVVCMNTWNAAQAEGERSGAVYQFRHTKNWKDQVEQAVDAITKARESMAHWYEVADELLAQRVTTKQTELFIRAFVPEPPADVISDRVRGNIEATRGMIRTILEGKTCEGIAGTAWGLAQAAGEYADHYRAAASAQTKFNRSVLRAHPLKSKAVALARLAAADKL